MSDVTDPLEKVERASVKGCVSMHPERLGQYIRLNVGGQLFNTTLDTLTKRDSMLRAMFTGDVKILVDSEGWVMIDRSGKHFGTILNYLRDGSCPLPSDEAECMELFAEAQFFIVTELVQALSQHIILIKESSLPICKVPIITSPEELDRVMLLTQQPIIRFLYNRSNNKYSYTGSSEENLLKNMELFDKLALCFQGRVVFIKDVAGQDICTWHFYGAKTKQAEVCCQSIVYAKDRKNIKIDFPEVRVYEEVLHIMLFENTSTPQTLSTGCHGPVRNRLEPRKAYAKILQSAQQTEQLEAAAASAEAAMMLSDARAGGDKHEGAALSGNEGQGLDCSDDDEPGCGQSEPYIVRMKRGHAQLSFNSKLPNVCRIPIVTEAGEFETIRRQTWRPIIRFVYNRSRNHFSYTSSSDECFLKNVELFDRLSVCFQERVLFVKDVIGNDVCSWYYYGHHKLRAEVSCQTIVYGTDKRQLRIDFPEARILEEVINIMLFQDNHFESQRAINALDRMATVKRNFAGKRFMCSDDSE